MTGIARKTIDNAGGTQLAGQQNFARCEGKVIVLKGDPILSHGTGVHAAPVMAQGSSFAKINGIAISRAGDLATCGHASTGSNNMRINA